MRRKLIVSIDVERDIVRYLEGSYVGVETGMPAILDVLRELGVTPDIFVESVVATRYPGLLHQAAKGGSLVGSHGMHTDPYVATELSRDKLKAKILDGVEAIRMVSGRPPIVYREANFAIDSRTFSLLVGFGFRVDSSVLPSRIVRSHGIMPLVDHRGAPDMPYRPGLADHRTSGSNVILEVPVTNNPDNDGAPVGTGFLNWKGVERTLSALRNASGDPVTFLVHPWECVDLSQASHDLPDWVTAISRDNTRELRELLTRSTAWFSPSTLVEVAEEFGVSLR